MEIGVNFTRLKPIGNPVKPTCKTSNFKFRVAGNSHRGMGNTQRWAGNMGQGNRQEKTQRSQISVRSQGFLENGSNINVHFNMCSIKIRLHLPLFHSSETVVLVYLLTRQCPNRTCRTFCGYFRSI